MNLFLAILLKNFESKDEEEEKEKIVDERLTSNKLISLFNVK